MTDYTYHHPAALPTSQRSPYAPALVVAYALGATLWTPALVLVARLFAGVSGWLVPGLPVASAAQLFAAMWLLRFALYVLGARGGWNYGYGINGVIVNRRLSLHEKARRIARDWFGILLMAVWMSFMVATLLAALPGR